MASRNGSIGVVLGGHLGDVVLYSSVLKPIRERFPDSHITLIASPPARELLGDSPYVDRAVEFEGLLLGPWRQLEFPGRSTIARLTRRLWAPSLVVDSLIYPYHWVSPSEVSLLRVVKRREVIGCTGGSYIDNAERSREFWDGSVTRPVRLAPDRDSRHVLDHIEEFLEELGCASTGSSERRLEIGIGRGNRAPASPPVRRFAGQPYGMIFPGASYHKDIKIWPPERYGEVLHWIGGAGPRCWVVCGAADEHSDCDDVVQFIHRSCPEIETVIACGESLHRIAAELRDAQLVIGADNGGMHMAVAVGAPAISIVSGAVWKRYFPWGDPAIHRSVMYPMDCWGCRYECIHPSSLCIQNITPQAVADECLSVLAVYKERRSGA